MWPETTAQFLWIHILQLSHWIASCASLTSVLQTPHGYWGSSPGGGGALPNIDRRHAPVDRPPLFRFALTQWPPFSWKPHPMTPYFLKSHPLPMLLENLHRYFTKNFARFARISKILAIFDENDQIRSKICENYTRWPPFLGIMTEKGHVFWDHTPNDPLFYGSFVTDRQSHIKWIRMLGWDRATQGHSVREKH